MYNYKRPKFGKCEEKPGKPGLTTPPRCRVRPHPPVLKKEREKVGKKGEKLEKGRSRKGEKRYYTKTVNSKSCR